MVIIHEGLTVFLFFSGQTLDSRPPPSIPPVDPVSVPHFLPIWIPFGSHLTIRSISLLPAPRLLSSPLLPVPSSKLLFLFFFLPLLFSHPTIPPSLTSVAVSPSAAVHPLYPSTSLPAAQSCDIATPCQKTPETLLTHASPLNLRFISSPPR